MEAVKRFHIGDRVKGRVIEVREDGKLNLSIREKGYIQMDIDSAKIMDKLEENNGFFALPRQVFSGRYPPGVWHE